MSLAWLLSGHGSHQMVVGTVSGGGSFSRLAVGNHPHPPPAPIFLPCVPFKYGSQHATAASQSQFLLVYIFKTSVIPSWCTWAPAFFLLFPRLDGMEVVCCTIVQSINRPRCSPPNAQEERKLADEISHRCLWHVPLPYNRAAVRMPKMNSPRDPCSSLS